MSLALATSPLDAPAAIDHGIRPTAFKCLVRPKPVETKTAGGIIKLEETVDRQQHAAQEGELVAVSPLAFGYETWPPDAEKPAVGQRVVFAKFAGFAIKGADGKDYRLVEDKDIAAVLA